MIWVWQLNPYAIPLVIGFAIALGLALSVLPKRGRQVANLFLLLNAFVGAYVLLYALELCLANAEAIFFIVRLETLVAFLIPAIWLFTVLAFTAYSHVARPPVVVLTLVLPIVFSAAAWTNEQHMLFWTRTGVETVGNLVYFSRAYGPLFYLAQGYVLALGIIALAVLLRAAYRDNIMYRSRYIALVIGMSLPYIASLISLTSVTMFTGQLDLVPFGLVLGIMPLGLAILRLDLLDLAPAAQDAVLRNMLDGVIVADPQGRIVHLNPAAEDFLQKPLPVVFGRSIEAALPAIEGPLRSLLVPESLRIDIEMPHRRLTLEASIDPLIDDRGRFSGRIVILRDVTYRRRLEWQAVQRLESFHMLISAMPNLLLVVNEEDTIGSFFAPAEFASLFNLDDTCINKSVTVIEPLSLGEAIIKAVGITRAKKVTSQAEITITFGGETFVFRLKTTPVEGSKRILCVIDDITALKQAEDTALRYATQLEERNAELDMFSRIVAHDLQAPLNVIIGYSNLLLEDKPDRLLGEVKESIASIERTAFAMSDMINTLLLLARQQMAENPIQPVETGEVLKAAIARLARAIEARGVAVIAQTELPKAMGNPVWCEAVFANLIGNAIKYIGSGNVRPEVRIRAIDQGEFHRFEIIDNGLGIAPENQARLFEMFSRFHTNEATGIGLAIVLRFVKRMGGQVGVESALGEGSTFWFTLPAVPRDPQEDIAEPSDGTLADEPVT